MKQYMKWKIWECDATADRDDSAISGEDAGCPTDNSDRLARYSEDKNNEDFDDRSSQRRSGSIYWLDRTAW